MKSTSLSLTQPKHLLYSIGRSLLSAVVISFVACRTKRQALLVLPLVEPVVEAAAVY